MSRRKFYIKESELDDFQYRILNKKIGASHIITGCAGSGKSILALWKAKQIEEEHKGSYLYIVYTKALAQYMKDAIREIGISENNVIYFWEWENKFHYKKADYIIIDEAQDFTQHDIDLFMDAANKALLIFGDTAQQLYAFDRKNPRMNMFEIQRYTNYKFSELQFNYRLPQKIANFAQPLNTEDEDLKERCCKNIEGYEKPKILEYNSLEEQFDDIISIVKKRKMDDVGILFRRNDEVEYAYNYFRDNGFTVEAKYGGNTDLNFFQIIQN